VASVLVVFVFVFVLVVFVSGVGVLVGVTEFFVVVVVGSFFGSGPFETSSTRQMFELLLDFGEEREVGLGVVGFVTRAMQRFG